MRADEEKKLSSVIVVDLYTNLAPSDLARVAAILSPLSSPLAPPDSP
jgi:hypothetical protein